MAIKLSKQDAVSDAIGSVRTEGLTVCTDHRELLAQMAAGQLSAVQVKRAMIARATAPKRVAAGHVRRVAAAG